MFSDRDRERLRDIIENADWIADDIAGVRAEQFGDDRRRADAVERCLQRITEAIIHLGDATTTEAGFDVRWGELRNLGNRLRHEYRRIDRRVIFQIAADDVPRLRDAAARALEHG